jgi:hypothetical protein
VRRAAVGALPPAVMRATNDGPSLPARPWTAVISARGNGPTRNGASAIRHTNHVCYDRPDLTCEWLYTIRNETMSLRRQSTRMRVITFPLVGGCSPLALLAARPTPVCVSIPSRVAPYINGLHNSFQEACSSRRSVSNAICRNSTAGAARDASRRNTDRT